MNDPTSMYDDNGITFFNLNGKFRLAPEAKLSGELRENKELRESLESHTIKELSSEKTITTDSESSVWFHLPKISDDSVSKVTATLTASDTSESKKDDKIEESDDAVWFQGPRFK